MDVRYEFLVNNANEGGFQIWHPLHGFTTIAGGDQTILNSQYVYLQNPNAIPSVNSSPTTRKGLPLSLDANGHTIYGTAWASLTLGVDHIRCFFAKIELKVGWNGSGGGTIDVPLVGRWVGGGIQEWNAYYLNNQAGRQQTWGFDTAFWSPFRENDLSDHNYTITDGSGIATYYALYGMALHDPNTGLWTLLAPPAGTRYTRHPAGQNFALICNNRETHFLSANDGTIDYLHTPIQVGETYYFREFVRDDFGTDGGHGWGINYTTAWNGTTGMLTVPTVAMATMAYTQGAVFDGIPTGTVVTFGGYTGTKGSGPLTVYSLPKGSLLDGLRATPADVLDPVSTPRVSSLPLLSGTAYPSNSSTLGANGAPIIPMLTIPTGLTSVVGPVVKVAEPLHSQVIFTGKSTNTLTGVTLSDLHPVARYYGEAQFEGGEVVTLPYDDLLFTFPDTTTQKGSVLVYEDDLPPYTTSAGSDNTLDSEGLDYALDPWREPHLVESREPEVWEWVGSEMERTFLQRKIMTETLKCPSQWIVEDHRRMLLAVQAGAVKLWLADDAWDTDESGTAATLDSSSTWTKNLLRQAPDGSLYAFLSTAAGAVSVRVSQDGGDTWDALAATGLPTQRNERGDARHDGERWYRAHPVGATHGITLYSSRDGETWTSEGAVSTDGNYPLLLVLPDGRLLCSYHDGTSIVCRTATDASGAWVWSSPVTIAACDPTGPAGFANGQKVVIVYRTGKASLAFNVSYDSGDTWTTNKSEG